ncbi:MAG: patatin-like phospholipase family protein [Holosporales bacterium]
MPGGDKVYVLVFAGGGALSAYQWGAYEVLQEVGFLPQVVGGYSMGGVLGALIASHEPMVRSRKIAAFFEEISWPDMPEMIAPTEPMRQFHNFVTSMQGLVFGQPNFFSPRLPMAFMQPPGSTDATSFYDTSKFTNTLNGLIDVAALNKGHGTRLVLSATEVETSQSVFFDSFSRNMQIEHIMASCALPPHFPAVTIGAKAYWDGAMASDLPLDEILRLYAGRDILCMVIDPYAPHGPMPDTIDTVQGRVRDLMMATRIHRSLTHIVDLWNAREEDDNAARLDVVHVMYGKPREELSSRDFDYSRSSIARRRQQGIEDMRLVINHGGWQQETSTPSSAKGPLARLHSYIGGQSTRAKSRT